MPNTTNLSLNFRSLSNEEIAAVDGAANYLGYAQDAGRTLAAGFNQDDYYGGGWVFDDSQTDDGLPDWILNFDYQAKRIWASQS